MEDGKATPVTKEMLDAVYKNAGPATPVLPPLQNLKLVNAELFQSINPAFVILFTPLLVAFWHWLRNRRREPSTPGKIGIGLALTAASALVMLAAVLVTRDAAIKSTAWWLFGTYAVITVGELCLSPMGLSLVNKMAPSHIRAFMMGGWFLSTAIGNKLSGVFGEVYHKWDHVTFFLVNAGAGALAAGAIFALLPWLRAQMED